MVEHNDIQTTQTPGSGNPFPGLRPFDTGEKNLFFGRDGLSDTLLEKLEANRFVAVVGTSGSGKSSLVRAGLLPALRGGFMTDAGSGWRIALFRPINNPIHNLAIALSESGLSQPGGANEDVDKIALIENKLRHSSLGLVELVRQARLQPYENLLIVADQFEELYRFEPSSEVEHPKDEASAFVRLLLEATNQIEIPIYVILTMRSDYLGDSAHFWGLPEAINRGQFLIPRMDDDEKREAIEGPVRVFDAKISSALVSRLLNDVGDDPRHLPIMQHALMRTWDYWQNHRTDSEPLVLEDYDNPDVGGMNRALSIHADEAYEQLTDEQKVIAQKMFRRLTEKGVGKREGRLPATVGELAQVTEAEESDITTVIEAFRKEGRSFLMPPPTKPLTSDTLIDISHESLIGGWTKLSGWVEDETVSAKIYGRLVDDALRYPGKTGQLINPELGQTGLLINPELEYAIKWRTTETPNSAWARRYRTDYGRALEGDNPPARPRWAASDDSEFDIAMRYLDLSEQKFLGAKRSKTVRRRATFIALASASALFLVLFIAAFVYAQVAEKERTIALRAEQKAIEGAQTAKTLQEQADAYRTIAEDAGQKAIAAAKVADDLRQKAVDSARETEALRVEAVKQGKRSNLLEFLFFAFSNPDDTRDMPKTMAAFQELEQIYIRDADTKRAATAAVQIGNMIINSPDTDSNKALGFYKAVLTMSKGDNSKIEPSVFITIGDTLLDSDLDKKEAIPYYQRALDVATNSKDPKQRINALIKLGNAYIRSSNPSEGGEVLYKAMQLALSSNNVVIRGDALISIADIYKPEDLRTAERLYDMAHEVYQISITPSPSFDALVGDGRALDGLGYISEQLKEVDSARKYYQSAEDRYRRASAMTPTGREKERAEIEMRWRRVTSRIRVLTTTRVVDVLTKTLQKDGIEATVKQYHDLKKNSPDKYDFSENSVNGFGYLLLRNKQVKEAIEIFKLNVEAYPQSYNTWDSLGEAYMIAGDKELAISNYEQSLKINPNNLRGKEALDKLKPKNLQP